MSQSLNTSDEESRTRSFSGKRSGAASEGRSSGLSTPNKRNKYSCIGDQNMRDLFPAGGTFSTIEDMQSPMNIPDKESGNRQVPSGALGQNRLASGFNRPTAPSSNNASQMGFPKTQSRLDSYVSTGESANDTIEISDDSDLEDDSEGGILINVDDQRSVERVTAEISEDSGEVSEDHPMSNDGDSALAVLPLRPDRDAIDVAHNQLQADLQRPLALALAPMTADSIKAATPVVRLGDLTPKELEEQIRYTLFHLNRDQIDLNRPVVCTICLCEGHLPNTCPEVHCTHCGSHNDHPSRSCPKYRRCLKCRIRGHDVDTCISKLKDTSIPCDLCSSTDHLEDKCPTRFFPMPPPADKSEVKLWVSCCICASKAHLVGDCPQRRSNQQTAVWSLRSLDPNKITNLSLESGTRKLEKEAENRGMRPGQGLKIKGRGQRERDSLHHYDDEEESFFRPPVGQLPPQSVGHIRFNNRGYAPDRRGNDSYHPTPPLYGSDHYEPLPPRNTRDPWYQTDSFGQRRRSRSRTPPYGQSYRPNTSRGYDSFQPPLPREPPPKGPPPRRRGPAQSRPEGPPKPSKVKRRKAGNSKDLNYGP